MSRIVHYGRRQFLGATILGAVPLAVVKGDAFFAQDEDQTAARTILAHVVREDARVYTSVSSTHVVRGEHLRMLAANRRLFAEYAVQSGFDARVRRRLDQLDQRRRDAIIEYRFDEDALARARRQLKDLDVAVTVDELNDRFAHAPREARRRALSGIETRGLAGALLQIGEQCEQMGRALDARALAAEAGHGAHVTLVQSGGGDNGETRSYCAMLIDAWLTLCAAASTAQDAYKATGDTTFLDLAASFIVSAIFYYTLFQWTCWWI